MDFIFICIAFGFIVSGAIIAAPIAFWLGIYHERFPFYPLSKRIADGIRSIRSQKNLKKTSGRG